MAGSYTGASAEINLVSLLAEALYREREFIGEQLLPEMVDVRKAAVLAEAVYVAEGVYGRYAGETELDVRDKGEETYAQWLAKEYREIAARTALCLPVKGGAE